MSETRKLKIALIGSSHTGAMKYAWDQIGAKYPNIEVNYLAAGRRKLRALTLGEKLVWLTRDGETLAEASITDRHFQDFHAISLEGANVVLHIGWANDPAFLFDLLRRVNVDGVRKQGDRTSLSRTAFDAILQDYCLQSLPPQDWHGWTDKIVICVETPRQSEAILDFENKQNRGAQSIEGFAEVFDLACDRLEDVMAQHAITFVRQPTHTLAQSGLTRRQYGIGSMRLRNGKHHPSQDLAHMNLDYGKQVWAAVLDKIQQRPALHQH
jgi:hypothetical protein